MSKKTWSLHFCRHGRGVSLAIHLSSRALGLTSQTAAVYCDMKRYPNAVASPRLNPKSGGPQGAELKCVGEAADVRLLLCTTSRNKKCMNSHGRQFSIASSCVRQLHLCLSLCIATASHAAATLQAGKAAQQPCSRYSPAKLTGKKVALRITKGSGGRTEGLTRWWSARGKICGTSTEKRCGVRLPLGTDAAT